MDKAYDAKFVMFCKDPLSLLPRLFLIFIFPCFLFAKVYEEKDIPIVMEQLFACHVENKELNTKIVKRLLKLYIENFDMDRSYLLQKEIRAFLNISDHKAKKILTKIKREDFSDFYLLNEIFKNAVERARENRGIIKKIFIEGNIDIEKDSRLSYARVKKDLFSRQKNSFIWFYNKQKKRVKIDSLDKKIKLFNFYEKKIRRFEKGYFLDEHFFVLNFLKAFAKSLDAHTYFFSYEEASEMRINLEKQFEGIGVVLTETIDGIVITDLIKKGPAYESGRIKINDLIVEINNENVEKLSFEDVLKAMKKRENGKIVLGLKRNKNILRVSLKSRAMDMADDRLTFSTEPYGDGIIGILNLKSFYETQDSFSSEKDIIKAIKEIRKKGKIKGIVLDFRENSGGFLSQAIKVAGIFITNGIVAISKYGDEVRYLRNLDGRSRYKGPLLVLTSKMSASAAEIVAQALQDYGVALVVGDKRTFGKGSIQYQTVTDDDSEYFYKVTIGKYYTVSGKTTQINGVRADIVVPSCYSPYQIGEKYLEYALESDNIEEAFSDSLSDIEPRLKRLFRDNYLPYLQKKVVFWKNMLPILKKNSKHRLENDINFKNYLKRQKNIKDRLNGKEIENVEWLYGEEDLQVREAINILKDMVIIESKSRALLNS